MNLGKDVLLHPDLLHAPQIARIVKVPLIGPLILPPLSKTETLPSFQLLRANIGLQGANELLKNMYNIV